MNTDKERMNEWRTSKLATTLLTLFSSQSVLSSIRHSWPCSPLEYLSWLLQSTLSGFNTISTIIFVRLLYWVLHLYMTYKYSSGLGALRCLPSPHVTSGIPMAINNVLMLHTSKFTFLPQPPFWTPDFHILSTGHFHQNVY